MRSVHLALRAALFCTAFCATAAHAQYAVEASAKAGAGLNGGYIAEQFEQENTGRLRNQPFAGAEADFQTTIVDLPNNRSMSTNSSASASADLATGQLKAAVRTSQSRDDSSPAVATAQASAAFWEQLFFDIAGNSNTVTRIFGEWRVHGTQSRGTFGSYYQNSNFALQQQYTSNTDQVFYTTKSFDPKVDVSQGGWSFSEHEIDGDIFTFRFAYDLVGANPILNLQTQIGVTTTGNAISDYGNTTSIRFTLPEGVTFTSASGVFLSQVDAVPEPATWAMLILGFGLVGAAARRRTDAGITYA